MLKIVNVTKKYDEQYILKDVSFKVNKGEFISILGDSGCGKSTLLNCMSGIVKPTSGSIMFNDVDITLFNDKEISTYRASDIGYIFQEHNLIDCLNVEENIKLPLLINKKNSIDITELLKVVQLEGFEKRSVSSLSGGQKQRVAIARSLVNSPNIIFADEPTSSLNSNMALEIKEIFKKIVVSKGVSIVMVTHSESMASGTKILKMVDGVLNEV